MARQLVDKSDHPVSPERFLAHYRAIREAKRAQEEAASALQAAHKKAKSDGVDLTALKDMLKLSKLDPGVAIDRVRRMQGYAKWAGLPFGTQLDMFAGQVLADGPSETAAAEQREFDAGEAGFEAGKAGKHRQDDNPYPPGSPLYAAFDRGYLRGQKVIAARLGENARPANARRTRRSGVAQAAREPAALLQ